MLPLARHLLLNMLDSRVLVSSINPAEATRPQALIWVKVLVPLELTFSAAQDRSVQAGPNFLATLALASLIKPAVVTLPERFIWATMLARQAYTTSAAREHYPSMAATNTLGTTLPQSSTKLAEHVTSLAPTLVRVFYI